MKKNELAARLIGADEAKRQSLMTEHASLLDAELATALKASFDHADAGDPTQAMRVAEAVAAVSVFSGNAQIAALAEWTGGIVALESEGRADLASKQLRQAASCFLALNEPLKAANVQVSLLQALAILGDYEAALDCGLQARTVFLENGDELAAGKIELNLGNLHCRRDFYPEAEQLHRAAQTRFVALGDQKLLTMAESCLALTLTYQYKFREAEPLYHQALARAEAAELGVTQAVIECNLGNLALFQGRYDQALDYLERSRRRYEELQMPHESAISELELSDAYLELNLAPEAAAITERVVSVFNKLGMRAEQARAAANHGRACLLLGKLEDAEQSLSTARKLFADEGNKVGEAAVRLTEAQILFLQNRLAEAADSASQAENALAAAGSWGRQLLARWLRADCARKLGQWSEARELLNATLRDAELQAIPQIVYYCQTSLGELAAATGDAATAENEFNRAVALIEEMRAPLPADEFRTAFVADKLTPYLELARLCLNDGAGNRTAEALSYIERARSRALVEMMTGSLAVRRKPRDAYEAELLTELEELRGELSWFYNQINRPSENPVAANPANAATLFQAARQREDAILRLRRQLEQRGGSEMPLAKAFDFDQLQSHLGMDTALIEYFSLGDELLAFVVTNEEISVVRNLGNESKILSALDSLHFQLGSLRYDSEKTQRHMPKLLERARHYLTSLYNSLLRPMESWLGERRLVVVPHRTLHYVPFHALHDGSQHVIERREVCYAPSAGVLLHCLSRPSPEFRQALLLGVPDEQTPRVRDEVLAVAPLFPESVALLDDQATMVTLREKASTADLLHLACHGQFRQDNPLFSSLQLADGWLTVRDAAALELNCGLVTLSACETGVNLIAPGDELIGLARGFFSAGAPSLLVSLWKVSDESTAKLMTLFYERLRLGERPAAALRQAQCELMQQYPHPFFWSPFVLLGRW